VREVPQDAGRARRRGGDPVLRRLVARRIAAALALAALATCGVASSSLALLPAPASASPGCALSEQANIPYTTNPGDGVTYYGDLWRPDDGLNHPGIVAIHGGAFVGGYRSGMDDEVQQLACAGFVVFNIDYRLDGIKADAYPDAVAAVQYLRGLVSNAGVGAHGLSAGAYLANELAIDGLVDAASGFSGGGPADAWRTTIYSAPLYMAHSIDDPNVLVSESEAVNAAYDALPAPGVPHRLDEVSGTDHARKLWNNHPELQQAAIDWFHSYLPLTGTPPPPPPTVTTVSPNCGWTGGGITVTISGQSFQEVTAVKFGSYPAASYVVSSPTSISAVTPPTYAGMVDVTVSTTSGTSAVTAGDQFTFAIPSPPTVSGVSPASGPVAGGTVVTITGSNFLDATAVRFGNKSAGSFTVVSGTTITATSPAVHAPSTVDVTVSNRAGRSKAMAADRFTYV
jgi:dienelactone hydrolase